MMIIAIKKNGIYHFVKRWRKNNLWRKAKIVTSPFRDEALEFEDGALQFGNAAINVIANILHNRNEDYQLFGTFGRLSEKHKFWVVCNAQGKELSYYQGMHDGKVVWTKEIEYAIIDMCRTSVTESVNRLRSMVGLTAKVVAKEIWLVKENPLSRPSFIITCTSKTGKQETKFFARIEGKRLRLVNTSFGATAFTYDEVLERFSTLEITNKNFLYAVLPQFEHNVNYRNLEAYVKEHKVMRKVITAFRMKTV